MKAVIDCSALEILTRELDGTYVELFFVSNPPLGAQTYGVVAKGSGVSSQYPAFVGTSNLSDASSVCLYARRLFRTPNSCKFFHLIISNYLLTPF